MEEFTMLELGAMLVAMKFTAKAVGPEMDAKQLEETTSAFNKVVGLLETAGGPLPEYLRTLGG